jgi:4-amino-4-deoxy-L-arabinose transferase-like glycosyltransferase
MPMSASANQSWPMRAVRRARAEWADDRRAMVLLFAAALVLRIAAVAALHNFATVSGYEFEVAGRHWAAGEGMYYSSMFSARERSSFFYPLYAFVLGAGFRLTDHPYLYIELLQAVLGAATVPLLLLLARRLAGGGVARWSALLLAGYPIQVYWVCRIQPLTIDVFFLVLIVLLMVRAAQEDSTPTLLAAGVVTGLAVYSKTLYLLLLPAWGLWYLVHARGPAVKRLGWLAVHVALIFLVLAPWMVRNWRVHGRYVGVQLGVGMSLFFGNNPAATGTVLTREGKSFLETLDPDTVARLRAMSEAERSDYFMKLGLDYIKAHPGRFVAMIPAKLHALWWFNDLVESSFGWWRKAVYGALLVPFVAGLALSLRRWRTWLLLYLMFLAITGIYAIFYGEARFRYVLEPFMMVMAAVALERAWRPMASPRWECPDE